MTTLKVTFQKGELKRYEVDVECKTRDSRIQKAYQSMRTNVLVFATNREDARAASVEDEGQVVSSPRAADQMDSAQCEGSMTNKRRVPVKEAS